MCCGRQGHSHVLWKTGSRPCAVVDRVTAMCCGRQGHSHVLWKTGSQPYAVVDRVTAMCCGRQGHSHVLCFGGIVCAHVCVMDY